MFLLIIVLNSKRIFEKIRDIVSKKIIMNWFGLRSKKLLKKDVKSKVSNFTKYLSSLDEDELQKLRGNSDNLSSAQLIELGEFLDKPDDVIKMGVNYTAALIRTQNSPIGILGGLGATIMTTGLGFISAAASGAILLSPVGWCILGAATLVGTAITIGFGIKSVKKLLKAGRIATVTKRLQNKTIPYVDGKPLRTYLQKEKEKASVPTVTIDSISLTTPLVTPIKTPSSFGRFKKLYIENKLLISDNNLLKELDYDVELYESLKLQRRNFIQKSNKSENPTRKIKKPKIVQVVTSVGIKDSSSSHSVQHSFSSHESRFIRPSVRPVKPFPLPPQWSTERTAPAMERGMQRQIPASTGLSGEPVASAYRNVKYVPRAGS